MSNCSSPLDSLVDLACRDGVDIRDQVQITGIERRDDLRVVQWRSFWAGGAGR